MSMMRLDKYLSNSTGESRSRVKEILKAGRIKVNNEVIKACDIKIDTDRDEILMDSHKVDYEEFVYYMFNKPDGCVSATKDGLSATVLDHFKSEDRNGLFPVGRLDKDSEGFLLLTNDGMLSHNLLSPGKHVEKVYRVILDREVEESDIRKIENRIDIGDDKPCLPAKVVKENGKTALITLTEGRYHQVKRMFSAAGYKVIYLKRISFGGVELDDKLKPGEYRRLTESETAKLKRG